MMDITAHALMDSSESTVRKKVFQFRFNFPSKPGFRIFFLLLSTSLESACNTEESE